MRLVYKQNGAEVKVGDIVVLKDGTSVTVDAFPKPHKPASSGSVYITYGENKNISYYVAVIDAEWIEREDRE